MKAEQLKVQQYLSELAAALKLEEDPLPGVEDSLSRSDAAIGNDLDDKGAAADE
jgi:hypothetical protein